MAQRHTADGCQVRAAVLAQPTDERPFLEPGESGEVLGPGLDAVDDRVVAVLVAGLEHHEAERGALLLHAVDLARDEQFGHARIAHQDVRDGRIRHMRSPGS